MNEVFTSIRRTPYQSLATFSILFFTLFLTLIILFSVTFLYGLLGYIETRPQVTVYFKTQTNEGDIFKIRDELTNSGKVLNIKYISKSDAFKIYKELNKDNPLLLEMVSADILPPSLEIYAKRPELLPEIADYLKNKPGVDEVDFQKVIIERLITLTNIVRKSSLLFFFFLIFNAVITLLTLGHFKTALKKEEIELLRFLGASKMYIKKPFLMEGLLFGLVTSTIVFLIFIVAVLYLNPFLVSYMRGLDNLYLNLNFYQLQVWPLNPLFLSLIFTIIALFGILISTITTFFATNKYIK
jgi:cell division transport system permease protein